MAATVLVEALPWDPATGAVVTVRLAGAGRTHYTHKGTTAWYAGVVNFPKVTTELGFDADGFTGGAIPQTAAIGFRPSQPGALAALMRLLWIGAPVTISTGDDALAVPVWTVGTSGTIAGYEISAGGIAFTLSDLAGPLAKPAIDATFAGTGGAEGIVEAKGRAKRRSWGKVWNVEGRILDKANSIYEFGDPARAIQAFDAVKDRGRTGPLVVVASAGSVRRRSQR